MKALRSSLEKARELKLNNQAREVNAGGVDKSQQQMIMELYQKCATLKVLLLVSPALTSWKCQSHISIAEVVCDSCQFTPAAKLQAPGTAAVQICM